MAGMLLSWLFPFPLLAELLPGAALQPQHRPCEGAQLTPQGLFQP